LQCPKKSAEPKDIAEIETGMAEKSLGLVWRNRKKISQIINAILTVLTLNYFMVLQ
jgi:hypothetical protein